MKCEQYIFSNITLLLVVARAELYVLLTVYHVVIFVNNQLDAQFLFTYVYFYSVQVADSYVSFIRRINCINTPSGICHSV